MYGTCQADIDEYNVLIKPDNLIIHQLYIDLILVM